MTDPVPSENPTLAFPVRTRVISFTFVDSARWRTTRPLRLAGFVSPPAPRRMTSGWSSTISRYELPWMLWIPWYGPVSIEGVWGK